MDANAPETVADPGTGTPQPGPAPTGEPKPEPTPQGAGGPEIPAAGQEPGGEPPSGDAPPPWASTTDPYEVLEHDEFRPILERRDRGIRDEGIQAGRTQAEADFNRDQATTVIETVGGTIGNLLERLGQGSVEGAEQLVDRIEKLVAPYGKDFLGAVRNDATATAYQQAARFFRGVLKEGLPLKAQHELEDFAEGQTTWGPILRKRDELLRPRIEAEIERLRESREDKEANAQRRKDTKPPVKPEGGGGGAVSLTREQLDKMTPQQVIDFKQKPGGKEAVDRVLAGQ